MSLIKTKITKEEDIYNTTLNPILKKWLLENKTFKGNIALDYRNRIRQSNTLVPFHINNRIIFKFLDTFQQNNKELSSKIRKYVIENIEDKIMCIGGESFIYGFEVNTFVFYSNSKSLCYESEFNSNIYNRNSDTFYIENYNKITNEFKIIYPIVVINLGKLNKELILLLNNRYMEINKLVIINCKPKDFWKKRKYLDKFKIKSIKHFISKTGIIFVYIFEKNDD
jgi:hypothetical protein